MAAFNLSFLVCFSLLWCPWRMECLTTQMSSMRPGLWMVYPLLQDMNSWKTEIHLSPRNPRKYVRMTKNLQDREAYSNSPSHAVEASQVFFVPSLAGLGRKSLIQTFLKNVRVNLEIFLYVLAFSSYLHLIKNWNSQETVACTIS